MFQSIWMSYLLGLGATALRTVAEALRTAFQDLKQDLKGQGWLRGLSWFVGVLWFTGILTSICVMVVISTENYVNTACQPDGSFSLHPGTYSYWSSTAFFQITWAVGSFTFAQAKVVDIVWDVGVGRGGQFLLAIVSWREFAKYITICMEDEPVTYRVFRAIFLENEASIFSTYGTIKSFIRQRKLRSKIAMTFMTVTMVFILAFPTLMSAMTGYDSNVTSRILDRNDNLIPFSNYSRVFYVIHDGWRVGLDGNAWITDDSIYGDPITDGSGSTAWMEDSGSDLLKNVSQYVKAHGLGGTRNEASQFQNTTLYPPVLNISAYEVDDKRLGGQNTHEVLNITWVRGNETYDYLYIENNGKCQNTDNYKWGFSFLQLFISLILLLAWTIGIYVMWLHTHYAMKARNRRTEEVSGEYRAILELAAAMRTELDIQDTESSLLKEKQLKKKINKEIRGGAVSYPYTDPRLKLHSTRDGLKFWFKMEKWWLLAILVTSIFCGSGYLFLYRAFWNWFWSIFIGQSWAFFIGTTMGSRLLIISIWGVVFAPFINFI